MLFNLFCTGFRFPASPLCRVFSIEISVWWVRPSNFAAFVTLPPDSSKACPISLASKS